MHIAHGVNVNKLNEVLRKYFLLSLNKQHDELLFSLLLSNYQGIYFIISVSSLNAFSIPLP